MSLTLEFPGLWSNPESPFLSHHHTCPFGGISLAAQEKIQQPGSSDSHVPGVVHTLINEDKSPIVLMLRGWNDTRRKTVSLQAGVAGGETISSYLKIYWETVVSTFLFPISSPAQEQRIHRVFRLHDTNFITVEHFLPPKWILVCLIRFNFYLWHEFSSELKPRKWAWAHWQ